MRGAIGGAAPELRVDLPLEPGWTLPRTPWGDPDFQGVWRYEATSRSSGRPLSKAARSVRRGDSRNRARRSRRSAARLAGLDGAAVGRASIEESPIRGNEYNPAWQDHGRPGQVFARTSLIVAPPDGRLPYTNDARRAAARATARYGVGPYESYLDPDTGERCLTDGVTALMWQGPNGGHNRIAQSPGYVTILHEEYRDRRIIPVDGRAHRDVRQWFGDAVGHWEGDTLVVDTTGFLDRTNYEWATSSRGLGRLHIVERFQSVGSDPWSTDHGRRPEDLREAVDCVLPSRGLRTARRSTSTRVTRATTR